MRHSRAKSWPPRATFVATSHMFERASDASMISSAVIPKPGCRAPSRCARPQITAWFSRASPGGSTSFLLTWKVVWPLAV